MQGRQTEPLRYDAVTDKYLACTWQDAFAGIGEKLQPLDPKSVVFYTSGKASLETSYRFGLIGRFYGHNNFPDSSNMCHETTSIGLKKVIGWAVGTCVLEDFDHCDAILYFGQNPGTNSPRFLHPLQEPVKHDRKIITFNPIREAGLVHFTDPQNPVQMLAVQSTDLSHMYLPGRRQRCADGSVQACAVSGRKPTSIWPAGRARPRLHRRAHPWSGVVFGIGPGRRVGWN